MVPFPMDFEQQLWEVAESSARRAGFGIAPDCATHIRNLVRQGVAQLTAENRLTDPVAQEKTRTHLTLLISEMVDEARRLGWIELHEPTFFKALSELCPLWPFC